MYHPLQNKRGSNARAQGSGPVRRVSSPDIKVNSVRTHLEPGRGGTEARKKIVRRGSFQGTPRGGGGRESEVHRGWTHSVTTRDSPSPHWTTQSVTGGGSPPEQSLVESTGPQYHPSKVGGSRITGVQAGTALPGSVGETHLSYATSQASWGGEGSPPNLIQHKQR